MPAKSKRKALEYIRLFTREDDFQYWVLLMKYDPVFEPIKDELEVQHACKGHRNPLLEQTQRAQAGTTGERIDMTLYAIESSITPSMSWITALDQYTLAGLQAKPTPTSWSIGQMYIHLIQDTRFYLRPARSLSYYK